MTAKSNSPVHFLFPGKAPRGAENLLRSELEQIKPDFLTERPADASVNYPDNNLGGGAYYGAVEVAARYSAVFVARGEMQVQVGLAVLPCERAREGDYLVCESRTDAFQ